MPATGPVGVGFIGSGMISDTYLENLASFPDIRVVALSDLDTQRARLQAEKHSISESGPPQLVLDHPDVEVVVNLTIPAVHAQVSSQVIAAGKHVWSEKPIGIDRSSAAALLEEASAAGLLVGIAPDTVLGPGIQTARRAIERGDIGVPLTAQTVMQYAGPDLFHPNPEFLFAEGAGPVLDVGPYYVTALIHIFGTCTGVSAFGSTSRRSRVIQVGERAGTTFSVHVPTHVSAIAQFAGGGISQSVFSFESPATRMGVVEITGTEGTLIVPDPNKFTGPVRITRTPLLAAIEDDPTWETVPVVGAVAGRGIGVLDMARAIRHGRQPLASGALGYHVLDVLLAMHESVDSGETVRIKSVVDPVPLVPEDWDPFAATL